MVDRVCSMAPTAFLTSRTPSRFPTTNPSKREPTSATPLYRASNAQRGPRPRRRPLRNKISWNDPSPSSTAPRDGWDLRHVSWQGLLQFLYLPEVLLFLLLAWVVFAGPGRASLDARLGRSHGAIISPADSAEAIRPR